MRPRTLAEDASFAAGSAGRSRLALACWLALAALHERLRHLRRLEQPYPEGTYQEMLEIGRAGERLQGVFSQRLLMMLAQFYQTRPVPLDCRLILISYVWTGGTRLEPQGAILQAVREPAERAAKLAAYQAKMQAFGVFLKDGYFADDTRNQSLPEAGG